MVKYYRVRKENQSQLIEQDKITRFLDEGWHLADSEKTEKPKPTRSKKKSSRQAIKVTADIKPSIDETLEDVEDIETSTTVDGSVSTESFDKVDEDDHDTN